MRFDVLILILCLGLIISGGVPSSSVGKSVEVFVPSTGKNCTLPDLPASRSFHTMEEMLVCGGDSSETQTSCLKLTEAGWETTTTLLEGR